MAIRIINKIKAGRTMYRRISFSLRPSSSSFGPPGFPAPGVVREVEETGRVVVVVVIRGVAGGSTGVGEEVGGEDSGEVGFELVSGVVGVVCSSVSSIGVSVLPSVVVGLVDGVGVVDGGAVVGYIVIERKIKITTLFRCLVDSFSKITKLLCFNINELP